jgi:4-amino-4-deoxy-L-arabinose transferase-like glycosyltransferase
MVFIGVLTLHGLTSRLSTPLWDDTMETWSWGRQLALGYYKHPPLMAWVARAWFEIFPHEDWSGYLLASVVNAVGLLGVWRVAGFWLSGPTRLAATFLPMLTIQHTIVATNFNANTILLPVWPWTVYALLKTLERPNSSNGARFGLMAGLALLGKYVSILLILACLVAALTHTNRASVLRSPAPYIAAFLALLVLAPHLYWLVTDGQSIAYALNRMRPSSHMSKPIGALVTLVGASAMLLPAILAMVYAIGSQTIMHALGRVISPRRQRNLPSLAAVVVLPLLGIELAGLTGAFKIQPNFLIPTVSLLPTLALTTLGLDINEQALGRLMRALVVAAGLLLLASPVMAWGRFVFTKANDVDPPAYAVEPVRDVALAATQLWHQTYHAPVTIVTGSELYSLGLAFYSPDRPQEFTHFDMREAPWITPQRLYREGILVVCRSADRRCQRNAEELSAEPTLPVSHTSRARLFGKAGPERRFLIYLIAPRRQTAGF